VLNFMAQKEQRAKDEKKQQIEENINKRAKGFEVKESKGDQQKASDKVPEHAKMVIDEEGQSKEVMDLKRRLKEVYAENRKIQANLKQADKKKREVDSQLDSLMTSKNLVENNGLIEAATAQSKLLSQLGFDKGIPQYKEVYKEERENPCDSIVKKIEAKGYDLEQIFQVLDDNMDELLTTNEIKMGLKFQGIELLDTEMKTLLQQIDKNSDGVLTLDEWIECLKPKFEV